MGKRTMVFAAVAIAMIAVGASLALGVLPIRGGGAGTNTSQCSSCSEQIVDVVMPVLGNSGNFTNPNRVVNMTAGESATFEVDVYPTVAMGFDMSFTTVLSPARGGQGQGIAATFNPSNLTVGANVKGVSFMTLTVAQAAAKGTYDVVVSAVDQRNGTNVWGLYFEISVS